MMQRDALLGPIWTNAVAPALALLPPAMSTPQAWHMMLAAGLQESGLCQRCQILPGGGRGPARSLWQFEVGGVRAVMVNPATRDHAAKLAQARGVSFDAKVIWAAMERDDVLAAGFARLLAWASPKKLPDRDDQDAGWGLYLDAWRPGKPRPQDWASNWLRARLYVYGG